MFIIIWAITFFNSGHSTLAIGELPFYGLVIAILADVFFFGWGRRWYFRS